MLKTTVTKARLKKFTEETSLSPSVMFDDVQSDRQIQDMAIASVINHYHENEDFRKSLKIAPNGITKNCSSNYQGVDVRHVLGNSLYVRYKGFSRILVKKGISFAEFKRTCFIQTCKTGFNTYYKIYYGVGEEFGLSNMCQTYKYKITLDSMFTNERLKKEDALKNAYHLLFVETDEDELETVFDHKDSRNPRVEKEGHRLDICH